MNELNKYTPQINAVIDEFCKTTRHEMLANYGAEFASVFDAFLQVLQRGGKRFRGGLAMYSYGLFGGNNENISAQIGLVAEILQTYLLVIDDVVDRSSLRRAGPTAHKIIEQLHTTKHLSGASNHFGISQTIFAGIIGQNLAYEVLANLPVDETSCLNALAFTNDIMIKTNIGQMMDVNNEAWPVNDESYILKTLRQKTAYYSMFLPLQLGAIIAGDDADFIKPFAMNMGLAFQIYDDIFGTFGDESKTGKPVRGDIIEGKRTVLVAYTLAHGTKADCAALESALGNPNLTNDEFKKVLNILRSTGALDYAKEMAETYARKAKEALAKVPENLTGRLDLLAKITDYTI